MSEPFPSGGLADRRSLEGVAFDAIGRVVSPRNAAYWRTRSAAERSEELERLRREGYGSTYDDLRMELVARIVRPGRPTVTVRRPGRRTGS